MDTETVGSQWCQGMWPAESCKNGCQRSTASVQVAKNAKRGPRKCPDSSAGSDSPTKQHRQCLIESACACGATLMSKTGSKRAHTWLSTTPVIAAKMTAAAQSSTELDRVIAEFTVWYIADARRNGKRRPACTRKTQLKWSVALQTLARQRLAGRRPQKAPNAASQRGFEFPAHLPVAIKCWLTVKASG